MYHRACKVPILVITSQTDGDSQVCFSSIEGSVSEKNVLQGPSWANNMTSDCPSCVSIRSELDHGRR
jgi:hypothetical protein